MGKFINESKAFRGTVGDFVGSSLNGKSILKGRYKSRSKPAKGGELVNHNKFKMAHAWLKPILPFVRAGFKGFNYKQDSQGYNAAKSYLLTNAIEGESPTWSVNPSLMKVSYGICTDRHSA